MKDIGHGHKINCMGHDWNQKTNRSRKKAKEYKEQASIYLRGQAGQGILDKYKNIWKTTSQWDNKMSDDINWMG